MNQASPRSAWRAPQCCYQSPVGHNAAQLFAVDLGQEESDTIGDLSRLSSRKPDGYPRTASFDPLNLPQQEYYQQ